MPRTAEDIKKDVVDQLYWDDRVDNKLTGVPAKDTTDQMIAESVVSALNRNPMINADAVDVRVANAVVRLSGAVPNHTARQVAYHSALHTFGVIGVDDQLVVVDQL